LNTISNNQQKPIYIHRGKNHLRYLAIIILISIALLSLYGIRIIGYSILPVFITSIIGLLSIRFPYVYVFDDHIVFVKKGILKRYNDKEIYYYNEIKEIDFRIGLIDWGHMILQTILGQGAYGGFAKPDIMIIKLQNDKLKYIIRFGSKSNFEKLIKKINKSIKANT
jgi:hypothetical protein